MKRKLVDHLVETGLVARDDIQRCVLRAKMDKSSVVDEMTQRLDVDQEALARAMAQFWGLECWEESSFDDPHGVATTLPRTEAQAHGVVPVTGDEEGVVRLAVYDVDKARPVVETVRDEMGTAPELIVAPRDVIERRIERHYRRREQASDANADHESDSVHTPQASNSNPTDAPTRQVDLETDNPFMDLVDETTPHRDSTNESEPKTRVVDVEEASSDFFDDVEDGGGRESAPKPLEDEVVSESYGDAGDDEFGDDFDEALQEFEDDLAPDTADAEELLMETSSSVNWGDFDEGRDSVDDTSPRESASTPPPTDRVKRQADESVTTDSRSGIFPSDKGRSGVFDFPDDTAPDLTLAEVVERQRKIIGKLEREIEYQKGILQTMAELLVEARVLSRRKLKSRLKAFREEQRKRYE